MPGSLVDAIARAYADPRGAMAAQIAQGPSESRALFHLVLACGLYFVASLPAALRTAPGLGIEDAVDGAVAAHLFGYLVLAPLLLYGVASVVHLAARAFGGAGGFLGARAAVFWSALLGAPIALALALIGVAVEIAGGGRLLSGMFGLGYAGLAFWLWLFAASLAEAEGFAATRRVAAVVVATFAGIAGLLDLLAGRGAASG